MNKKMKIGLLLLAAMALVLVPQASAYPSLGNVASCGTCHIDPNGGGPLTPDGEYYKQNGQLPPTQPPAPDNPPVIAITSPADGQTFTTDAITVSGTASDDVGVSKVEVKVGAGSYVAATGNTSWSAPVTLASGPNTIYARATDTSGNTTETSVNVTYNPSTSPTDAPPVIAITSPTDGQTFTTDAITVNGTASDDVGVSKVEVKVGAAGSWQTATGNTSWNSSVTLASGSNTIYARATDTAGQTTETSVTVNYNLQTPPPGTPPSTAIKVTFTVVDNETGSPIAGAKVSMNGSKIKTDDNGTATFTNIIPGDYKYKVRAEDYEKNKDSISVTGDITVTVKLVPETEEDEHIEDGAHGKVHWLENIFEKKSGTGFTAGIQNNEHAGQDEQDEE